MVAEHPRDAEALGLEAHGGEYLPQVELAISRYLSDMLLLPQKQYVMARCFILPLDNLRWLAEMTSIFRPSQWLLSLPIYDNWYYSSLIF